MSISARISLFICMAILVMVPLISTGQITSYSDQVKREIERRGLDEAQLRALLFEKSIDLDNLENLTAQQILDLQRSLDELEKLNASNLPISNLSTDTLGLAENDLISLDGEIMDSVSQDMIEDTITSQIYGQHLFAEGRISVIETGQEFVPPDSYILASGDVLAVSVFGRSRLEESYTVKSDGSIIINKGNIRVFVRGLRIAEARDKLLQNFKRFYSFRSQDFTLSVSSARSVSIQVFGEVISPGTFTVSGLNSVLNLLSAAGGLTPIGSVRNIQLIKRNGEISNYDIYELLTYPVNQFDYFLEDGDLIFVPTINKLVEIDGAVTRSMKYELKETDQLFELIKYAGGLKKDAYLSSIDVVRYGNDQKFIRSVPYAANLKARTNFPLVNGDEIHVSFIMDELENYVSVKGEVRNEGDFERVEGMTIADLIRSAGMRPTSRTDLAILKRINNDGSINMLSVSIDNIVSGVFPLSNLELQDRDELTIWKKERFTDNKFIKVAGAVRDPQEFPYDESGSLRASDAILMAGGLMRNAATYAHVHRLDPLNPSKLSYVRLDLSRLMTNPNSVDNILLEPFDSIHVYAKDEFYDDLTIQVAGAVNNPGQFLFGEGMNLADAVVLAGGLKRSASTNNIEVSRVIIRENQPTKTVVQKVALNRDDILNFSKNEGLYQLEPFDNVFVRYVPEFELQQNIVLEGEVTLPGEYSLVRDNETVAELIQRAGGLTKEAFPAAATLYRSEDSLGQIVMRLDEVMMNRTSRYNYALKNGDVIYIPKKKDYVTISGATQYLAQSNEKWLNVPYHEGKDALFYIDFYAGGFADDARKEKIFVRHPNGEVKTTERRFPFGKRHPQVLPGSIIEVGKKKPELPSSQKEETVNWTRVLGDSVAQAMSILTLILLVQRLD